ncbi:MAG: hypothetical protein KGL94_08190 [Acidobacteriota bacterium]|nr:hypothetical protein [Acidobacteriota bacterium]
MILWLRLAFATAVVLAPGVLVARALGRRSASAAVAWSVAVVAGALALTFAVQGSLWLTLGLDLGAGALALPFAFRRSRDERPPGRAAVFVLGLVLGALLWGIEGVVRGDAIFHLGRIRKLEDFGALSLKTVDEFKDGGLHPGYAFPLWHGWLALVARVAGVDPSHVVAHESSLLAPLAVVLAYEMGVAVFRSAWLGFATMLAQVALIGFALGSGGAYTSLELPATVSRQLLIPAAITLFFAFVRTPSRTVALSLAAAGMDIAFVHPTYALFIAIPLAGYLLVRGRRDAIRNAVALTAFGAPVLGVFAWLEPIVAQTRSHNPSATERAQQLRHYAGDLVVHSQHDFHLAAGMVSRSGAIAIAGLVLVPLAGLAARRRWSAFVLGGSVLVLVLELWSLVFPHFSDLVSLSQSRRAAGFVPFAFALAGGAAVLARLIGPAVLPVALAAGIALQLAYPGGVGLAAWIALFGGLAALVVTVFRRGRSLERPGALAALAVALFLVPVVVHGLSHWSAAATSDRSALTPGVVRYLRADVPRGAVVFADLETSYRISGYVPVYVCNAPPAHVADTTANRPQARRAAWLSFLATGNLAIPRRYHAGWLVLRPHEPVREAVLQGARVVYRDASFIVLRL